MCQDMDSVENLTHVSVMFLMTLGCIHHDIGTANPDILILIELLIGILG